jgi:hypothetical protein
VVSLREWLRWLVSQHVQVDVRRTALHTTSLVSRSATPGCDRLTQGDIQVAGDGPDAHGDAPGTSLASSAEKQRPPQRRRSES